LCPYCTESIACKHLVLRVNCQLQSSEAGVLSKAFTDVVQRLANKTGEDHYIDHNALMDLLSEFTSVVEFDCEWQLEGSPGRSFDYWDFYIKTPSRIRTAEQWLERIEGG